MADEHDEKCPDQICDLIEKCHYYNERNLNLNRKMMRKIPDLLLNLKWLQFLYLEGNHITSIPGGLCVNLESLKWLDLRNNKLQSLPLNIHLLRNLKNLLLENNNVGRLPVQLGLLNQLSGLNIARNPLVFPAQNIIESGTKVILHFLHQHQAEEEFEQSRLSNTAQSCASNAEGTDYQYQEHHQEHCDVIRSHKKTKRKSSRKTCLEETSCLLPSHHRFSLDETYLDTSPPYQVNMASINAREKHTKVYEPNLGKIKNLGYVQPIKPSKAVREPAQTRHQREVINAERKKFNEKADAIIDKQKTKVMLDNWREKARHKQQNHVTLPEHQMSIPYGNDLMEETMPKNQHARLVKEALATDHVEALIALRDKQLEQRIEKHANNLREWRRSERALSIEQEVKETKRNVEEAYSLKKDIDEKRALEYRLRAFVGEDFSPPSHPKRL